MSFASKLSDMPMDQALRIFQRGTRSGKLMIWRAEERGVIWMLNGQVVHAIVINITDRSLLHTSEAALRHLLTWDEGHFRYTPEAADSIYPVTISKPTCEILAMAEEPRHASEVREHAAHLTPDTVLAALPQVEGKSQKLQMSAMEWIILVRIGQERKTLQALATECSTSFEHIAAMATTLLEHGLVRPVTPRFASAARHKVQASAS
ncbi:MAG: DUF4388 domain-containing protein [Candidatus Viridilinea halotolerans]|uniref:DUF4388 domain-containing protein n=1 Tax=Candidatus Viridilinea halotolerans TaxID=2491704 RepID=A0A426U5G7_9CHLR|nr:MAG: DUF4388 domain-containing protein [Candidatus Viridilinea halotolerans]